MADSKEELICPACGAKMAKIFIEEYNHYIDICLDGCGGMFFDNRELEHFDEKHENVDKILELTKDKAFKAVDQSKPRVCPVCSSIMVKNATSQNKNNIIDCCYSCGGKFLDHGELEAMRKEYDNDTERSAAFNSYFSSLYSTELTQLDNEVLSNKQQKNFSTVISRTITIITILIAVAIIILLLK